MNWLTAIVQGLFRALFSWGQDQAEKPRPVTEAETPPAKLHEFQDRIEEYKHRKDADESRHNPS